MDKSKRERLEAKGWKVGSAYDFLEMPAEEISYVEVKLTLSDAVRGITPVSPSGLRT
jgi:hypothetical protein